MEKVKEWQQECRLQKGINLSREPPRRHDEGSEDPIDLLLSEDTGARETAWHYAKEMKERHVKKGVLKIALG